jgi:hypothetical protein
MEAYNGVIGPLSSTPDLFWAPDTKPYRAPFFQYPDKCTQLSPQLTG